MLGAERAVLVGGAVRVRSTRRTGRTAVGVARPVGRSAVQVASRSAVVRRVSRVMAARRRWLVRTWL